MFVCAIIFTKKGKETIRSLDIYGTQDEWPDPTGEAAAKLKKCKDAIDIIESCALNSDKNISSWIFLAVTEGLTFNTLKLRHNLPCERDMFYDRRRKYYILLDLAK